MLRLPPSFFAAHMEPRDILYCPRPRLAHCTIVNIHCFFPSRCIHNLGLLLFLFCSMLGDKASRGSKWTVLDAGKKYLTMPIYDGAVPEEVSYFLS